MKHLKFIAALTFFLAVTAVNAQQKTTNWPQLKSVQDVAARINMNIETNNKTPFYFAETLANSSAKLSQSNIPKEYASNDIKKNVADLVTKTEKLSADSKGKTSLEQLKAQFEEIKTLIAKIATPAKK
ncbi:hypothetical protein [Flavobacterium silvaticum]|uniref:Uncharacterized protein n=1 Tax=Flavobacterium silvaticum TaxID=1852020 RepID=A0A972FVB3_9FLAO|nr:hypothetical protein [Flavobacterium silvaticum]NMH29243.1 hypothetical protein [Flavobacterium silvaticum]